MQTLKNFWEGWKKIAHKIGTFQSKVLLTVFYCVILAPFGMAVRLFQDPLHLKKPLSENSHWKLRKEEAGENFLERAKNP